MMLNYSREADLRVDPLDERLKPFDPDDIAAAAKCSRELNFTGMRQE